MPISFKSPEINLKNYNNDEFLKKFTKHEHIIVRNTFDIRFIKELHKTAKNFYVSLDEKFKKKKIPKHEIAQYFGNFQNTRLICINKKKIMDKLYEIIKNSNLADL